MCQCFPNFAGRSCQSDTRICSTFPCLNNGTCLDSILNNTNTFKCQCRANFYGIYCENAVNLCQNETCSENGYCTVNSNEITCRCFLEFSGIQCEVENISIKIVHYVQMSSVLLCFVCIGITICIIILNDVWDLLIAKSKNKIDKNKASRIYKFKYTTTSMKHSPS